MIHEIFVGSTQSRPTERMAFTSILSALGRKGPSIRAWRFSQTDAISYPAENKPRSSPPTND